MREETAFDARSARLGLRAYVRWLWVLVAAAGLGWVAGLLVNEASSTTSTTQGTLTLALTEEVNWPFYDAVLARQAGILEDYDLANEASASTGIEHRDIGITKTNSQNSTLTVEFEIEGGPADAEDFGLEVARLFIDANLTEARTSDLRTAEVLRAEAEATGEEIEQLENELEELTDEWVSLQRQLDETEDAAVSANLRGELQRQDNDEETARRALNGALDREANLLSDLSEVETQLGSAGSTIELSAPATIAPDSPTDARIVFAALFALAALFAIPHLERRFGTVRSPDHVGLLWPDAHVIDARGRAAGTERSLGLVSLAVLSRANGAERPVAVATLGGRVGADRVVEALQESGVDIVTGSLDELLGGTLPLSDSAAGVDVLQNASALALLVPSRNLRLRDVEPRIEQLRMLGIEPDLVALIDTPLADPASEPSAKST